MDTLTHALSGLLLGRVLATTPARARPLSNRAARIFGNPVPVWQALLVSGVAATFPDSDAVLKFVSDLAYLRGHRGITHSLVMLPLWAVLIGGLLALLLRQASHWKRFSWLAAAGLGIHIAGDWITQFGTMLLAPLSDTRYGLGSTFIIDLVFSGIIVVGLLASAAWWRSRLPATVALALLPVWVGISLVGRGEAIAFGETHARSLHLAGVVVSAAPRPASPFNWTVVIQHEDTYRVAHVNTRRAEPVVAGPDDHLIRRFTAPYQPLSRAQWETLPRHGTAEQAVLAREVWSHPSFDFFRWFAMFPALYRVDADADGTCVWYRDLRFAFPGRDSVPFRYGLCRHGTRGWQRFAYDDIAGRAAMP